MNRLPELESVLPPLPGDSPRQIGSHRLLRQLGEGGMSSVYLAYDAVHRRNIAVKVLADHLANDQQFVQRFYREANMSRLLDHAHIVKGYAAGQDGASRRHFLVLEYVDGPSLQRVLDEQGCMPASDAVRAAIDVARALEYLHARNYVHRDIKPGNILLDPSGAAKLIDLGLAKHLDEASLSVCEQGLGTSYYMPYEQARNSGLVDGRSDIFALGATLYHLITGEVPFPGLDHFEIARAKEVGTYTPASQINPAVPEIVDDILARMLARDPRRRFASAGGLIEALLDTGLADEPSGEFPAYALEGREQGEMAATRVDLPLVISDAKSAESSAEAVWSIRYRRPKGGWRTHPASTRQIVDWTLAGLLPAELHVARSGQKQYRPLRAYPEFCNLPEGTALPTRRRLDGRPLRLAVTVCLAFLLSVLAVLLLPGSRKGDAVPLQDPIALDEVPPLERPVVRQPQAPAPPPSPGVVSLPREPLKRVFAFPIAMPFCVDCPAPTP